MLRISKRNDINEWYTYESHKRTTHMNEHTLGESEVLTHCERWGAGVETQKNVRGEVGGWGRVPFNEPYAPSLSTIYDGA